MAKRKPSAFGRGIRWCEKWRRFYVRICVGGQVRYSYCRTLKEAEAARDVLVEEQARAKKAKAARTAARKRVKM